MREDRSSKLLYAKHLHAAFNVGGIEKDIVRMACCVCNLWLWGHRGVSGIGRRRRVECGGDWRGEIVSTVAVAVALIWYMGELCPSSAVGELYCSHPTRPVHMSAFAPVVGPVSDRGARGTGTRGGCLRRQSKVELEAGTGTGRRVGHNLRKMKVKCGVDVAVVIEVDVGEKAFDGDGGVVCELSLPGISDNGTIGPPSANRTLNLNDSLVLHHKPTDSDRAEILPVWAPGKCAKFFVRQILPNAGTAYRDAHGPRHWRSLTRGKEPFPVHELPHYELSMTTMSPNPPETTSNSNYDLIFENALKAYKKKTGKDLTSDPLLRRLETCNSPDTVLGALREQIPDSGRSGTRDDRLMNWLDPTVNVLLSFSATIGGAISLPYPPAGLIFTGIGSLLSVVQAVSGSRGVIIELFERIENFFRRLETYIGLPRTAGMTEVIVNVMVEVLIIVGLATREIKQGRIKRFLKKLIGRPDIKDALQRLDNLAQEESRM
ncbi:hypothetical protein BC826DRAFT_1179411, partial [Russula brevipes]